MLDFSLLWLAAIFCCFLSDFVNIFYIFSLFLTFWTFLDVNPLLNNSSKFQSQYLYFYSFFSIFLGKDYYFQEKAVYRITATIKEKNVLVTVQINLYKDVCRWNHVAVIPAMGWFSCELIEVHRIFRYFTSTCFREINKILIFAWIYFREYPEIVKKKNKKKLKGSFYSVFLFCLNV